MKAVVTLVARSTSVSVEEIDISSNPELEAQYGLEIPVLAIEGRKAAKYRVTEDELRRILVARTDAPGGSGHPPTRPA
jgi:hypothetical protein